MTAAVAKIIDLQAEINRDIDYLVDFKLENVSISKSIENTEYQTLLAATYLSVNIDKKRTCFSKSNIPCDFCRGFNTSSSASLAISSADWIACE